LASSRPSLSLTTCARVATGPISGETEFTGDLPPYVIPGGSWEESWRATHPKGHQLKGEGDDDDDDDDDEEEEAFTPGSTEAHTYAGLGEYENLKRVLEEDGNLVNKRDRNGWMPIHEAVRHGDPETVAILLMAGADASARVGRRQEGASPLYLLEQYHDENDFDYADIRSLLKEYGGIRYEPYQEL